MTLRVESSAAVDVDNGIITRNPLSRIGTFELVKAGKRGRIDSTVVRSSPVVRKVASV
jgi:hypothetical protein